MHDIRFVREYPAEFDRALQRRGEAPLSADLIAMDAARRKSIREAEEAQARRNRASKAAGKARADGDLNAFEQLRTEVVAERDRISGLERDAEDKSTALDEWLMSVPNLPYADVPDGEDETGNLELRKWGSPPEFAFRPLEHHQIAGAAVGIDFESGAKLSGSRFVVLSGALARLHRILAQMMIDTHVEVNGLAETWTPVIVREGTMRGTGHLPKFTEDSFQLTDGKWLIPTAEVSLTNLAAGMIVPESTLPLRFCAHTQCFRSEAGAAGKDTAGMLRQHQFEKVEMVSITGPKASDDEQKRMTRCAEGILEALGIHYRTVSLCTGDLGFGARRTFDIEVWLPGQGKFREISSVSTCGDFQARRMNARYRPEGGGHPEFVHTLNGSGLAIGRTLIAVLENGQQSDGSVVLPKVLSPYLQGKLVLSPDGELV